MRFLTQHKSHQSNRPSARTPRAASQRRWLQRRLLPGLGVVSFALITLLSGALGSGWPGSVTLAQSPRPQLAQVLEPATLPAHVNPYEVAPPLQVPSPLELRPTPPPPPSTWPQPLPPNPGASPGASPSPRAATPAPTLQPRLGQPSAPLAQPPQPKPLATPAPMAPLKTGQAGQAIEVTRPPSNIQPRPGMVQPKPARPQFPPLPRQEVRGVWMTTSDMGILLDRDRLSNALDQLAKLNFNTLYPVVWNSGYALHPSAVAQRVGSPRIYFGYQGQDPLAEVIAQGHRRGLAVMPWFEFGFMVPPSSELALAHPDWLTQKANGELTSLSAGGENAWLNPFHPEVRKFLTDLVLEVVSKYDVDGIQFDDHMALPRDFGYDSYTKALYQRETGKPVPGNPADQAWMRWRADKITEFIGDLHDAVKTRKAKTVFSVSPNYHDFAYKFTLQDWLNWVRQDFVDEIVMQVYRSDYNSFLEQIERAEVKESLQKISTAIGVLSGLPRRQVAIAQVEQQSRAVQSRGLGIVYFFYESLWDYAPEPIAERQARFASLFSRPAPRLAQLAQLARL